MDKTTLSRPVSIDAGPAPITIDPASTAAIVVDMQNDFAAKGGMSTAPESISQSRAPRSAPRPEHWQRCGRRESASST